ncbi:MAG: LamG-like jellyroll fold domain-containing protein [Planctomycetota bacterium]
MDNRIRTLIFQAIDQTISDPDFESLQDAIEHDPKVRDEYLRAVGLSESLREIAEDATFVGKDDSQRPSAEQAEQTTTRERNLTSSGRQVGWRSLTAAAMVIFCVGGIAFWLGWANAPSRSDPNAAQAPSAGGQQESRIAGHATLRRIVDLAWSDGVTKRREGDLLPNGKLAFDRGVAEIDFFCGATLVVEGPAELEIENDWSVRLAKGRIRATVPPAARGFIVKAADSEIIDLGTEFAVEVEAGTARVEVVDGEVELRGGAHDGQHLVTGEAQLLKGAPRETKLSTGLSTSVDVRRRQQAAEERRFTQWKNRSLELRTDSRLIAYYPIASSAAGRIVRNAASHRNDRNGLAVGPVERTVGRFGALSTGLRFDRPGARVRTRIDGEFAAFTFCCWARIDSLKHRYNALFMADSYETGEPHWQIRDDGKLMFSVMVDDTQEVELFNKRDQRVVKDAGLHRVYFSEPIWEASTSGQWFHLVAVYDPVNRRVQQYVNGRKVASEAIVDAFHITSLRIGAAEIGNWGQPFRKTPWFAVRNLDGTIDEMAIYDAALNSDEVSDLYEQGKPLAY